MHRQEALLKDQQAKKYIEKNKLRALFAELTKELLLKRPEQPLAYLTQYLQKRNRRQLICIQGYDEQKRTSIAKSLSNKFNFALINVSALLGQNYHQASNKIINQKVLQQLKKVQKVYKGVVISGYPNNAVQIDALQKSGELPERYFVLQNDQQTITETYLKNNSEQDVSLMLERNRLELKEVHELLGARIDALPLTLQRAMEKVNSTVSIRFKKIAPLQAPRIVVLHPPFLIPPTLQALINKYSLYPISVQSSFAKLSHKQGFKNYVQTHIRQHKSLSKETELALIETQCKSAIAKAKGFVLRGWPCRKQLTGFLKQHFLNPHMILVFSCITEKAVDFFNNLDAQDPVFSISDKPSVEQYKVLYKQFTELTEEVKSKNNCNLLSLTDTQAQVFKTFESLIENPKIYS